jgi:hypothetical protein
MRGFDIPLNLEILCPNSYTFGPDSMTKLEKKRIFKEMRFKDLRDISSQMASKQAIKENNSHE